MKVHLSVKSPIFGSVSTAYAAWKKEDIIPNEAKHCDGYMMGVEYREFLTDKKELVTCKRCLAKTK
ncbi:MAG: hypothetical protein COB12_11990 [Flavobacterium sp.]|nr:MAG: hypothetical protein COB12_11990 [Flavobacterium sp.]